MGGGYWFVPKKLGKKNPGCEDPSVMGKKKKRMGTQPIIFFDKWARKKTAHYGRLAHSKVPYFFISLPKFVFAHFLGKIELVSKNVVFYFFPCRK